MHCEALLNAIRDDFARILGDNLVGIYVHGSIAFDCFTWEKSDVDFIAVVRDPLEHSEQVALIRALMTRTPDAPPKGLEMSVVLEEHCRDFVYPTPFELHFSNAHREDYAADIDGHCRVLHGGVDPDLAAHFSVIRAVGRVLCGPAVDDVFGPVPREAVLDSVLADVGEFGDEPLYHTLNLCRTLALVEEGLTLSKAQGARWATERFPEYRPLLENALACYASDREFAPDGESDDFRRMMLARILQK